MYCAVRDDFPTLLLPMIIIFLLKAILLPLPLPLPAPLDAFPAAADADADADLLGFVEEEEEGLVVADMVDRDVRKEGEGGWRGL